MTPALQEALRLLGVGMITVFTILSLVVLCGSLLIRFVNRYFPVKEPTSHTVRRRGPAARSGPSPATVAAIVTAVEIFTAGAGKVQSINLLTSEKSAESKKPS